MPADRAVQVHDALRGVAGLANIADHPDIKQMNGSMTGWSRFGGRWSLLLLPQLLQP